MSIHFRKMTLEDQEMVMNWRMQPDVTRFMATDPKLTIDNQIKWFKTQELNKNAYYWIAQIDGVDAGVVSVIIDPVTKCGETSSYIAEKAFKNMRHMTDMIANLLDLYFFDFGSEILYGEVYAQNKGVVLINRHLGYTVEEVVKNGHVKNDQSFDIMKLSMAKRDWQIRRNQIYYEIATVDRSANQQFLSQLMERSYAVRKSLVNMGLATKEKGLHFGGSLSCVEIMSCLCAYVMDYDLRRLGNYETDRLILSKGHAIPTWYALMHHLGFISDTDLNTFKMDDTWLSAHPSMNDERWIDLSSGSLGQGLSVGVGMALGLKRKEDRKKRVFVLMGDGECNEGSVWEAAMSAGHFKLSNLVAIVDKNGLQYDGTTSNVMDMPSLRTTFESFGWFCLEIDGHDNEACINALSFSCDKPLVIIANTVKGKGISFMENEAKWHHASLTQDQYNLAMEELDNARNQ